MEESSAAIAMEFAPFALRSMWSETALTRIERYLKADRPSDYNRICESPEDYGMAIEFHPRGTEVGQYGYDTNFQLVPDVDDHVVEADGVEIDHDLAEEMAELWVGQIVKVVEEAQSATTLSEKEFVTLITMNNDSCIESRAADALGVSVGTYRGKKGRIKEKQKSCQESTILDRLSKQHEAGYKARERTIGELSDRDDIVTPSEIRDTQVSAGKYSSWKQKREDFRERTHETYEQPHWRTAHIEGIDKINVSDTAEAEHDDAVRIDVDGLGSGGGDLHHKGENIQTSLWLDKLYAIQLYRELGEALETTPMIDQESVAEVDDLSTWISEHVRSGRPCLLNY